MCDVSLVNITYGAQELFVVLSFTVFSLDCRSQSQPQRIKSPGAETKYTVTRTLCVSFWVTLSFLVFYVIPKYVIPSKLSALMWFTVNLLLACGICCPPFCDEAIC